MGPYKIVNNFLESSGENILFGGGPATYTPADIEIRGNHIFKPLTWKQGAPGFIGGTSGKPFIVKNLFELKNAQRVLFEGNILENSWGGFSQTGFAILLTPKNQNNRCSVCKVTDVVIRLNYISHVGSGMQIASILAGGIAQGSGGERYSIHDNIFDDIDGRVYGGFGVFALMSSDVPPLRDIAIRHNTAFPSRGFLFLGVGVDREKISNFVLADNVIGAPQFDLYSTGGGQKNCAFGASSQPPTATFKNCFSNPTITHNLIVGSKGGWPNGNFYTKDASYIVEDFRGGKGGNYRLCGGTPNSRCKKASEFSRKGSDGKDPGADVQAVNAATDRVR
jgi:hypothetical protein